MVGAVDLDDYGMRARQWATSVWASWVEHHDLIRVALDDIQNSSQTATH